jgi:transcriptional regulator with XRE-family HTH domain
MTDFCLACGSNNVVRALVTVPASEIGLPSGTLSGVEEVSCGDCGEDALSVPSHGAVIKEYRKQLARISRRLSAEEFAFLRRSLGVTGKDYAAALGVTNVTISRVEHGESVPALHDSLVRALTFLDTEAAGAIERFVERGSSDVDVDVVCVERSRPYDVTFVQDAGEDYFPAGNVVPIRRTQVLLMEEEFEAGNDDVFVTFEEQQRVCR